MAVKVSTIIPIYNVENYLAETIESIIVQDIGFLGNCEIILINDSSPDNSEKICLDYVRRYPNNIRYIKQKNAGVSKARNNGLNHATGEFVHFLDSDDVVSKNAYSKALALLEENKTIDLAAFRVEFFDGKLGEHPLNYKFKSGTRIVDLNVEPSAIVLHVSSCVMRRKSICSEFDSTIKISEDMKFLTEQVMQKCAYGIIPEATYYYRKRRGGNSAIDTSKKDPSFYNVTPEKVYKHLLNSAVDEKTLRPRKYVQYVFAYDLQWRIRQSKQTVLTKTEENEYIKTIKLLIKRIDDDVLLNQKEFVVSQLHYIFSVKYDNNIPENVEHKLREWAKTTKPTVIVEFINILSNGNIRVEGRIPNASIYHDISVRTKKKQAIKPDYVKFSHRQNRFMDEVIGDGHVFSVDLPVNTSSDVIEFYNYGNRLAVVPRRQSKLPHARFGYRKLNDMLLVNMKDLIVITNYTGPRHASYEVRWLFRILIALRLMESLRKLVMMKRSTRKQSINIMDVIKVVGAPVKRLAENIGVITYRLLYRVARTKKSVWIISDRPFGAGDNGEAFNRYVQNIPNKDMDARFAISKKSEDYSRLKEEFSNVIHNSGLRYKLLFLRSTKIISSQADDPVINPFRHNVEKLCDLYNFDFVFLQHGIIRYDLSEWLSRYNKNVRLFVTSAAQEKKSVIDYDYGYTEKEVLLSGLPRFDLLSDKSKKKIILAPTWRHSLAMDAVDSTGKRPYNPDFKNSDYFTFFNSLINDKRLGTVMKKHGYIGEFYLHPLLSTQASDFSTSQQFNMMNFPYNYRKAFEEGSLLITDYSSVFFDFAYLHKPIMYTQFDKGTFFDNQLYSDGYMDDEKDGFGPVVTDIESAVEEIIRSIENGCRLEKKYEKRIKSFYAYHDKNSSKRVYDAVMELERRG